MLRVQYRNKMRGCLLCPLLLLSLLDTLVAISPWRHHPKPTSRFPHPRSLKRDSKHISSTLYYPVDIGLAPEPWYDKIVPAIEATGTIFYGCCVLLYSKKLPGQLHIITMLRATGFDKIEAGIKRIRRNIRDAMWTTIWNSPSLFRFKRNFRSMKKRMGSVQRLLAESQKAKADGVVTASEAAKLKKLRQKEVAEYKKELERLKKASVSLRKVWIALDISEIKDVVKGFLFQMMAVLSSGHNDSFIGKLISRWCLFCNLGTLFLDVNRKLRYPISKLLLTRQFLSSATLTKPQARRVEATGQVLMFSSAGFMVLKRCALARELNASLLSAAIIFKGLRSLAEVFWDDSLDTVTVWSTGGGLLKGYTGGLLMIYLTCFAMKCRKESELLEESLQFIPHWLLYPFEKAETTIEHLVRVMDRVL